tara:strand:- start:948 stop:1199 length:252 start_codon:yes stop_codon:yes gene_type:complete
VSEQEKKLIYENEGSRYDVSKFTDEGKTLFRYLIETNQEINVLRQRIDILQAANIALNSKIKEQFTNDMLSDSVDSEEVTEES